MILGLSHPDAGAVEVYGMAPRQAVRGGLVSAVMQAGGLLKDLTVAEMAQYTAAPARLGAPGGPPQRPGQPAHQHDTPVVPCCWQATPAPPTSLSAPCAPGAV